MRSLYGLAGHVLTSIAISIAGQSLVMGLSGRLDQPEMQWHWGELAAALIGWTLALSNAYVTYINATPMTILNLHLAVSSVGVPVLIVALYCQVKLHNQLVTSGVPLSHRKTQLIGLGLPKWQKKDWSPRDIMRSSIASMDPSRMREDLAAEAMAGGGVPMPPKRYGSVRIAPKSVVERYSVNPAFFSLSAVTEESAPVANGGSSSGELHPASTAPRTSSDSPTRITFLSAKHDSSCSIAAMDARDEPAESPSLGPEEWA